MAALATAPDLEISVGDYLRGDFRPDVDFVDDHIEERNVGELDHSRWQLALVAWFLMHKAEWGVVGFPELRIRVAERRYRVPDVCVFARDGQPTGPVPSTAPLAVFEVLSPEDRFSRMLDRLVDFTKMGVRNVFVIESSDAVYRFEAGTFLRVTEESSAIEGSDAFVNWKQLADLRF